MKTVLFALTLFTLASCSTEPEIQQYIIEDEELVTTQVQDTVPKLVNKEVKWVIRTMPVHHWEKGMFLVTKVENPNSFKLIYGHRILYNEPDCEIAKAEKAKAQIALDEWKATNQHIKELQKSLESCN